MASQLLIRSISLKPVINRPLFLSSATSDADPYDVVASVASIITNYRSKSRWATILAHCPQGLTALQVSQILLQIRSNVNLACSFFRFTTENALTSHDVQSMSTMMHILARAHKKTRVETLMRTAIESFDPVSGDGDDEENLRLFRALVGTYRSCHSSPLVFDVLIRIYLEMNRIDKCLHILKLLQSSGFKMDLKTCNAVIAKVANVKGIESGYELYLNLFAVTGGEDNRKGNLHHPNVATFNVLLKACHREQCLHNAEEIWTEMRRLKCEPNPVSYSILMSAYWDKNEVEKACELWEEMKSECLNRSSVAYNTMIGGWCKIGKVEDGEELYREMTMAGIDGNSMTYRHLINGYCKNGNVSTAYLHFKKMCRKESNSLDVDSVELLVRKLSEEGMVKEALQVLRHVMRTDISFNVRRSCYEFLIKGLCGKGEMDKALILQAEMVGKGFEPNYDIYAAFVDGYTKLGNSDMAQKLREEMTMNQSVSERRSDD